MTTFGAEGQVVHDWAPEHRVPDEAWAASQSAMKASADAGNTAEMPALGLRAAAPFIARAAQVQVLREIADEIQRATERERGYAPEVPGLLAAKYVLRNRADEIEAQP